MKKKIELPKIVKDDKDYKDPHDRLFRSEFSKKEIAIEYFSKNLPEDILKTIDLKNMSVEKDTFVDSNLKKMLSDLLYKVPLKD